MQPRSDEGPRLGFGEIAAEPPAETIREELRSTSTSEGSDPPDSGGVVSPDHSQAAPEPDMGYVAPRDHAPVAPD